MNKRIIFIGDIHGCYEELVELLELIDPTSDDLVVSLGDFVDRGPLADKCVELWIKEGYLAVIGNHDQRLVDWYLGHKVPSAEGLNLTLECFSDKNYLIEYLSSLPTSLSFKDFNAIAVHAALNLNELKIDNNETEEMKNILLRGRFVRSENGIFKYINLGKESIDDKLWVNYWRGSSKVFYGHTPTPDGKPLIVNNTYGLDTGCSYGLFLTAAILTLDGKVEFKSVSARQKYWVKANKNNIVII